MVNRKGLKALGSDSPEEIIGKTCGSNAKRSATSRRESSAA